MEIIMMDFYLNLFIKIKEKQKWQEPNEIYINYIHYKCIIYIFIIFFKNLNL